VKAYRFGLASVARIRALQERVARDELVLSQRSVRRAEEAVYGAESALRALRVPEGPMTPDDLVWIGDQAERLSSSLTTCRETLAGALSTREQSRQAWNVAAKRSGVLERLDQQDRALWRVESLRQETAELDDLAQIRHVRPGGAP
jgi:flagellar export protein FliJ